MAEPPTADRSIKRVRVASSVSAVEYEQLESIARRRNEPESVVVRWLLRKVLILEQESRPERIEGYRLNGPKHYTDIQGERFEKANQNHSDWIACTKGLAYGGVLPSSFVPL